MSDALAIGMLSAVALAVLVGIRHLLMLSVRLTIGEKGILDRTLRLGWIRWEEIEGAYQPSAGDRQGLHLKLKPTRRLARRLHLRDGAVTDGPIDVRLDLAGSGFSATELLHQIVAHGRRPAIRS